MFSDLNTGARREGGGGGSHVKKSGMLVGKFEFNRRDHFHLKLALITSF